MIKLKAILFSNKGLLHYFPIPKNPTPKTLKIKLLKSFQLLICINYYRIYLKINT